jgi:hypothetical protein
MPRTPRVALAKPTSRGYSPVPERRAGRWWGSIFLVVAPLSEASENQKSLDWMRDVVSKVRYLGR